MSLILTIAGTILTSVRIVSLQWFIQNIYFYPYIQCAFIRPAPRRGGLRYPTVCHILYCDSNMIFTGLRTSTFSASEFLKISVLL